MYRKSMLFAFLLLFYIMFSHVFLLQAGKAELIQLRIWTDKEEYLAREPIIVHYEVENTSDTLIKMNFFELGFLFNIKDQDGRSYNPQSSASYGFAYPDSLKPGESYKSSVNIVDRYLISSPGEYACFLKNPKGSKRNRYMSPEAKSNIIKIKVREPKGIEKEALDMFLEAENLKWARDKDGRKDLKKRELGFLKYQELVSKYPNSIYAPLALQAAIGVYFYSKDLNERRKIIPLCMELIEEYLDFYDFVGTFTDLVHTYEILKDREGAIKTMQELIKKHPNTKISEKAEYWSEKIEKWEFK